MDASSRCPQCSQPLAPGAPHGLCPACLLKAGGTTAAGSRPPARGTFEPPTPEQLAPLFPQLEITALVGRGGMGAVYRARQPTLDRAVALKILPPEVGLDPGFSERFAREARALARLSHPHIVAVHDFGAADGYPYLLMEFVDGVTLRHVLETARPSPREALAIVPQICEALQYAHDRGIVHRDIKPENILIDRAGTVKIADFGLAKLTGRESTGAGLTRERDVMGTPHYMAPEQVERPLEVDHRADIYSLGVVFYQMLTGELPIGRFAVPSRKVQIDVRLDEVVLRALEKEPEQRYQQASALQTEVETIATSRAAAPLPSRTEVAWGWEYRSALTLWGLPLLHIATGRNPATGQMWVAKGIIAIGEIAYGVLAIGGWACGIIACGGMSTGVVAIGGMCAGIVACGGLSLALLLAYGGIALAPIAIGGGALGYYASGGDVYGVHPFGSTKQDPMGKMFFETQTSALMWIMCLFSAAAAGPLVVATAMGLPRRSTAGPVRTEVRWLKPLFIASAVFMAITLIVLGSGLILNLRPSAKAVETSPTSVAITPTATPVDTLSKEIRLPTSFDVLESNPEILRLLIQQAEVQHDEVVRQRDLGTATTEDARRAADRVALLRARLAGDRLKFAQISVQAAKRRLEEETARYNAGVVRPADVAAARNDLETEQARLRDAEARNAR